MQIKNLFNNIAKDIGEIQINSLSFDSREVTSGGLFFCLVGGDSDGHDFSVAAQKNGAVAIVASRQTASSLPHIIFKDTRSALGGAASKFYGEPYKKLKMIGITGTNGKTTTTYIVQSILKAAKKKVGLIGTTAIMIGDKRYDTKLTTPDPIDFHSTLARMVDEGIEYLVMEVSAHALALRKMEGVKFDVAAFTNLSRDHLDFFGTMENYFNAKNQLFTKELAKHAILNADDTWVSKTINDCPIPFTTFGAINPADIFAIDLSMSAGGLKYILNLKDNIREIKFNMPGKFNMYNTLCAAAICFQLKISLKSIVDGIRNVVKVDGRFQIINTSKCSIIVDFAHTDDGLKNILSTIKEFAPKRIITVFGCGGDRDKTKRPVMGNIVSEMSDFFYITSDNPRTEKPENIMSDIEKGVSENKKSAYKMIADRKLAIKQAVEFAEDGDIVLVAGKGAEPYMEIGKTKIPYSDEEYILGLVGDMA